ncbi:MAG: glycosyltransferase [Chitinophagales bacterium]
MDKASEKISALYLCYDGMTDPLGQSQVIPYLKGLAKKGVAFHLISFEKKQAFQKNKALISTILKEANIHWHPLKYTKQPPVLSTLFDIERLFIKVKSLDKKHNFDLIHCRGYITSMVGLRMKLNFKLPFVFDMRAFYADERVDGGHWKQSNFLFRKVYQFFKRKELEFLENAAYTVSLTEKGKTIIHSWEKVKNNPVPIQVIPCCADLELFDYRSVNQEEINALKTKLGINRGEKVLVYSGSVGTWYLPDEMLDFYNVFRKKYSSTKFLFLTTEQPEFILQKVRAKKIPESEIIITASSRDAMPLHLAVADYSIFFIKPVFSKSGSSPTKMGEIMGMGIPLICNSGVGDVDLIVEDTNCGVCVNEFNYSAYEASLSQLEDSKFDKAHIRKGAFKYYDLSLGVDRYWEVYNEILQQ